MNAPIFCATIDADQVGLSGVLSTGMEHSGHRIHSISAAADSQGAL